MMKGTWSCLTNSLKMLIELEEWIILMTMTTAAIKITLTYQHLKFRFQKVENTNALKYCFVKIVFVPIEVKTLLFVKTFEGLSYSLF